MRKLLILALAVVMVFTAFAGCNQEAEKLIVVAEEGSAGETVAKTADDFKDYTYTAVGTQAKALMEVSAGTADAAIVDYVMSIGSIGEGTDYANLKVEGTGFNEEDYGIAFRKGSDMTAKVNEVIKKLKENGTLDNIAKTYKLQDILTATDTFEPFKQSETDSDWAYIQGKGKLVIGITLFSPMNYKDDNGELIGFETEFAKAVCAELGIEAEFVVIDWKSKEVELNSKNIDCIWNGMTIDDDRKANMSISIPYMKNKQVKIVKAN